MPVRTRKRAKAGYMISAVAEIYKLHPQTLRLYERVGLLKPSRSQGNTRLYTDSDLERLDVILTLARDMGVNLAGIEIILNMREKMIEMERQMGEFAVPSTGFPKQTTCCLVNVLVCCRHGAGKLHAMQGDGMETGAAARRRGGQRGSTLRLRNAGTCRAGDGTRADSQALRALRF